MCLSGYERSAQNTCDPKTNTNWYGLSDIYYFKYLVDMLSRYQTIYKIMTTERLSC